MVSTSMMKNPFKSISQKLHHEKADSTSTGSASTSTMAASEPGFPDKTMSTPLQVVELFQSQGCSSCPPSNHYVLGIAEDPNLLVLTYEVTYWDYLGWKDTFGNQSHDARQRDYCNALGRRSAYTPQVIVNGRSDGVGNNSKDLKSIIARGTQPADAPLPPDSIPSISVSDHTVVVEGPRACTEVADVLLVLYDPATYDVKIERGENKGRTLPHKNVVKDVLTLGQWSGGYRGYEIPGVPDGLEQAVLLQLGRGGKILAAHKV